MPVFETTAMALKGRTQKRMYTIKIQPQWEVSNADGVPLPVHLLELLAAVHATGSLAAAARQYGLSYRYAWGQLKQAGKLFGQPLLSMHRGQGARLTALAEHLIWAANRINARLAPTLDSLAGEIETELSRTLTQCSAPLRIHAPHGFGVETLRRCMARANLALELKYRSPDDALAALRAGQCDLAGFHLPIGELEPVLLAHYRAHLRADKDRVIHLAMRRLGLVLPPGNPRGLCALEDLLRPDVRMVQRQPGSGSRLLLEAMLARQGIALDSIACCSAEEPTHAAVAACVASGFADAGFALEPPARRYGLEFLPLITERYFFVCSQDMAASAPIAALIVLLQNSALRAELGRLPGYDPSYCGEVQRLDEAFASLRQQG